MVVGGITIFGALLRLYHLGFKPLWLDEAVLYWISNSNNMQNVIANNASSNSAPPLFAILINFILKIGDSETVLRSLSWMGGVAAIPAIYFLSKQFFDNIPAYFSTLLVAIALTQIEYSQQLREYSLTFLIATIILTFFYKQVRHPTWYDLALMTVAMVIGIFLQYGLALLIIALDMVCVIVFLCDKENRRLLLLRWGISQFIVLCAVIAVYFLSLRQQMTVGFGATSKIVYLSDAYWNGSIRSLLNFAISNMRNILDFTFSGELFIFVVVIGLIFILRDRNNYIALLMFAFPTILTFVLACARLYPYQGARQDIFLTPMIYLLCGFGFYYLLKIVQLRWIIFLILLFIIMFGSKPTIDYLNNTGAENIRPVVATLSNDYEVGDKIYVYYSAKPAFTYYYKDNIDYQIYGTNNRGNPNAYYQEIDNLLSSNNRIWMVFSHCFANECELIPKYISENHKIDLITRSTGTWLYLVH